MLINVLREAGLDEGLYGLGLSFGLTSSKSFKEFKEDVPLYNKVLRVAMNLSHKDGGHNKIIESIQVWLDITAPRYWWSEMDTYRVGITKNSESTMHTLAKHPLTQENFEYAIQEDYLVWLNGLIASGSYSIDFIKNALPDGFLQKRIVSTNYKVLRNIMHQRLEHRLPQWRYFCTEIYKQLETDQFLGKDLVDRLAQATLQPLLLHH